MKKIFLISLLTSVVLTSMAQPLTFEQIVAKNVISTADSITIIQNLPQRILIKMANRLESPITMAPPMPVHKVKKTHKVPTSTLVKMYSMGIGDDFEYPYEDIPDPYPNNPYENMGVTAFTSGYWQTYSPYSWELTQPMSTILQIIPGIKSFPWYSYPSIYCKSSLFYIGNLGGNEVDQYGDPKAHLLLFWFTYSSSLSMNESSFVCGLGNSGNITIPLTNLPYSSTCPGLVFVYAKAKVIVPPYYYLPYPKLIFNAYKDSTAYHLGPNASLNNVQWSAIDTPIATSSDFKMVKTQIGTTNAIKILWNATTYRPETWSLMFAGNINGPYSTNIQTEISVSGNTASVIFPIISGENRFYKLIHHF